MASLVDLLPISMDGLVLQARDTAAQRARPAATQQEDEKCWGSVLGSHSSEGPAIGCRPPPLVRLPTCLAWQGCPGWAEGLQLATFLPSHSALSHCQPVGLQGDTGLLGSFPCFSKHESAGGFTLRLQGFMVKCCSSNLVTKRCN